MTLRTAAPTNTQTFFLIESENQFVIHRPLPVAAANEANGSQTSRKWLQGHANEFESLPDHRLCSGSLR